MMFQAETEREALMEQCRVAERMSAVYTVEAYWREEVLYRLFAEDSLLLSVEEFIATALTRLVGPGQHPSTSTSSLGQGGIKTGGSPPTRDSEAFA